MTEYFFDELSKIIDFKPWYKTNKIFWELCDYCISNDYDIEIDDKVLSINKYCSIWEYELEKYYSNIISQSSNPKEKLKDFIYYDNYYKLTQLEYINFTFFINKVKNILFIWWWPLPLSAIILANEYWIKSKIIDCSPEAVEISNKLIVSLWLDDMIQVVLWDANNYKDDSKYDICCVASLVFLQDSNNNLLKNIYNLKYDLLLTRTSSWTRELMYKKIDKKIIKKFFNIQAEVNPKNDIINSFILSTKN